MERGVRTRGGGRPQLSRTYSLLGKTQNIPPDAFGFCLKLTRSLHSVYDGGKDLLRGKHRK